MSQDTRKLKPAEKRGRPDSSFDLSGPITPDTPEFHASNSTPKDLRTILDFSAGSTDTETDWLSNVANMDEETMNRFLPLIIEKLQPRMTQMANAAADIAIEKYREEIRQKDELIEMLRKEISDLRSRSLGATTEAPRDRQTQNNRPLLDETTKNAYDIEALEQYGRRNCVQIKNVPEAHLETISTDEYTMRLALKIGAQITKQDIGRSHTLGKAFEGKYSIIVRFISHNVKREFLKKRSELKGNPDKITICESLTKHRRLIMKELEALRHAKKLFKTWTDDGKVLFKHSQGSKTKSIPVRNLPLNGPYTEVATLVEKFKPTEQAEKD